jgi:hypothetical protein
MSKDGMTTNNDEWHAMFLERGENVVIVRSALGGH